MAQLPISVGDAGSEIKKLIKEKTLDDITSKLVRKHLEAKFKCNLDDYWVEIDELIETCIYDMGLAGGQNNDTSISGTNADNAPSTDSDSSEGSAILSTVKASTSKLAERKRKSKVKNEENIAEMDMASVVKRRRSANQQAPKTKAKKQVKPKEDKKGGKKRESAFTKICVLSTELSCLLGKNYMRRSDVVKAMWAYFKGNNLMDPKNKQFVCLDDRLKKIFGEKKKIKAFGMMSELKHHVKDVAHLDVETRLKAESDIAKMLEEENSRSQNLKDEPSDEEDEDTNQSTFIDNNGANSSSRSSEVVKSEYSSVEPQPTTSSTQPNEGTNCEGNGSAESSSSGNDSDSSESSGDDF